jgi:hypothetical protein
MYTDCKYIGKLKKKHSYSFIDIQVGQHICADVTVTESCRGGTQMSNASLQLNIFLFCCNSACLPVPIIIIIIIIIIMAFYRICGLVVRVLGYRSGGPGSIPDTTRKKSGGSGTESTQPREYN